MNPMYEKNDYFNYDAEIIDRDFNGDRRNFYRVKRKMARKLAKKEKRLLRT